MSLIRPISADIMTNDTRTMEIGMPFFGDNDHFPDDFFLSTFLWNRLQTLLRLFVFVTTSFSDVAVKKISAGNAGGHYQAQLAKVICACLSARFFVCFVCFRENRGHSMYTVSKKSFRSFNCML